ncbi:MAG: C69 family dipeptidase [Bacteroidales bacterium]|nr:C69 family dipeptidase [Bacteroidales bacterium]
MKNISITTIILMVFVFTFVSEAKGCFAVIAGRDASLDGSVLFAHLEQNSGLRNMSYRYVPRMEHKPGSMVKLRRGGSWPQPEVTWAYLWTSMPGAEFSDGYFNEWGVAISSDACRTREDSYDELVARGDITDGGIGYKLRRIVAQRATTAREGVEIATTLLDHFGYAASGRTYIIADPNEAWLLAVVRGKHWIAQRVPDDAVVLLPNVHIIGPEADLSDAANVMASKGLVEYAIKRGWYDPASGEPFSFREAFNADPWEGSFRDEHGIDERQWFSQSAMLGQLIELPVSQQLPFAITVDRKLGVEDLANLLRSHGHINGQAPLLHKSHSLGVTENTSPHHNAGLGAICSSTAQELVVYQLRNWMPAAIGAVAWRTTAAPCGSVLVPWYAGITETPPPYYKPWPLEQALDIHFQFNLPPGTFDYDSENAFDVFNAVENMIDLNYSENIAMVRQQWDAFEAEQFAMQDAIEELALKLWQQDPELAKTFLTDYSNQRAMKAFNTAKEMLIRLKTIHWAH